VETVQGWLFPFLLAPAGCRVWTPVETASAGQEVEVLTLSGTLDTVVLT
jgi:hypothetical protein